MTNISRVTYFGTYSRGEEYARNEAIIAGLKKNGVQVQECRVELWATHEKKMAGAREGLVKQGLTFARAYLQLLARFFRLPRFDVMMVGYIGHIDMIPARLLKLLHRKPIVFDAFYSLYDTVIKDRGLYPEQSLQARLLRLVDRWSCRMADMVLLDTWAHVDYFVREFKLDRTRFLAVPLGTDEKNFYPRPWPEEDGILDVISYSSYIPLHGIDVQLRAAELLAAERDIRFTFIGTGQLYQQMRGLAQERRLDNVSFIEWLSHAELTEKIAAADVCLGIFGTTEKASRVIPYKVYEALAMRKPVITGDSPAARELLQDGEHALLSPMGDAEALAERICTLRDDPGLRQRLAEKGHALFRERCTAEKIAWSILQELEKRYPKLNTT